MNSYLICLEIAGPTAMWTRPDSGDAPVSYPVPTCSAAQGIFESILWLQSAQVEPTKVEICAPLVFHQYTTNYGGPLRKSEQIREGNNYQLLATVLINVCYRLYAEVRQSAEAREGLSERARRWVSHVNGAHAYLEMFQRRLRRGQFHHIPCLGWREFLPDYVGPCRAETRAQEELNFVLPSMLHRVFPAPGALRPKPRFRQNVRIEKGVLSYVA